MKKIRINHLDKNQFLNEQKFKVDAFIQDWKNQNLSVKESNKVFILNQAIMKKLFSEILTNNSKVYNGFVRQEKISE